MFKNVNDVIKLSVVSLMLGIPTAQAQSTDSSTQASAGALDEVIVTAQRRSESLQDVAVAVEAVDQDEILRAGLESAQDLGALSPALGVNAGGGPLTSLFVRGVGALTVNPLTDAAVAQNVDGVYLGRSSGAAGLALYDIERVELLKGPQGTLYGRNATGGVVNYIPQKPVMGEDLGYVRAEFGDFNKTGLQGALNYGVSDTTAIRLSGNYLKRDGYSDDGTNDADSISLRGQVMFEPSDVWSIRVAADYSENNAKGPGGDLIGLYNEGREGSITDFTPSTVPIDSGPSSEASNAVRRTVKHKPSFALFQDIETDALKQDLTFTGIMAELNYQMDNGTLTVVPAYRKSEQDYAFAGPGFAPAVTVEENEQTSLEARFATDIDGPLNGILGAFFIDEEIETSGIFAQTYNTPMQNYENGGESWAVFADGTYDMSDDFRLTAGVRYTEDEKYVEGDSNVFVTFCGGTPRPGGGFLTPGNPMDDEPNANNNGCSAANNMPVHPRVTTPEAFLAALIESGAVASDETFDTLPWDVLRVEGDDRDGRLAVIQDVGDGALPANTLEFDKTTYRLGIEWDAGPSNLVYAGFSTGYRAGGVDIGAGNPTYDSELIDAYTIGSKNRFLDETLQVNAEAFYWEYEGQQISYFTTIEGAATFPVANGDATIEGVDVDVIWAATDKTTIGAYFQFLESTYDDLELKGDEGTGRFGCVSARVEENADPEENDLEFYQCAGNDLLFSPEFGADISINHVMNLNEYELSLTADIAYRGEQGTSFSFLEETVSDAYTTLNLDATIIQEEDGWALSLYVRNATDERILKNSNISNRGKFYAGYNAPQTFGVSLRSNF